MSLLDKASLIVTPNSYKESKLYSVVPNTTLGDMDVVRATTATRVNSAGLIEVVPRNLLTYSNTFNDASWVLQNASITTNAVISPNGLMNASAFTGNGSTSFKRLFKDISFISGVAYTISVYAKANTNNFIQLLFGAGGFTDFAFANFNIANGTIGTIGSAATATITNAGDGWYRCTITATAIASTTTLSGMCLITSATSTRSESNTLSTSEYIYGAQLEAKATATEYFPTTTRLNIPRIDYTNGSCPSLLVEPQRTNLVTSSDPTAYTSLGGSGIVFSTFNWGIGLISNSLYYPNNSLDRYYYLPCVNSTTYAISFFAKKDDLTIPKVGNTIVDLTLDLIMDNVDSFTDIQYKLISNNVYRVSGKILSGANFNVVGIRKRLTNSNNGIRISGLQLELGSYPTSYIPTVASTVTRNADVISKTGISSLIGQTEGTIFVEANLSVNVNERRLVTVSNGNEVQRIFIWTIGTVLYASFNSGSVSLGNFPIGTAKIAVGYTISGANTTYSIKVNNNSLVTGTTANAPNSLSAINLGSSAVGLLQLSDRINSVQLYKTRLTDTEIASLTTL